MSKQSSIPYGNLLLRPIVIANGGWTQLLAPSYNASQELLDQLHQAGLSKDDFFELRSHARDIYLLELAKQLFEDWKRLTLLSGVFAETTPFKDEVAWHEFPYPDYWLDPLRRIKMTNFQITKEHVSDCILNEFNIATRIPSEDKPDSKIIELFFSDYEIHRAALILWILTTENRGLTELELLSLLLRLQLELKPLPIRHTYTFQLFVYGIECKELSADLLSLYESDLIEIEDRKDFRHYLLSQQGFSASKEITPRLAHGFPVLVSCIHWLTQNSWAQQISYFYSAYPEFRATNRS